MIVINMNFKTSMWCDEEVGVKNIYIWGGGGYGIRNDEHYADSLRVALAQLEEEESNQNPSDK